MRAVTFSRHGDGSVLELTDRPVPQPGDGEVLVEVRAAGVNPIDWKFREGAVSFGQPFPQGMGWDVAGVVAGGAPSGGAGGAGGFTAGDEVYGMLPLTSPGAYQRFAVVPASALAPRPAGLPLGQAAAVPMAALTAWQSLDAAGDLAGRRVLVHAGAGGVGHFAVQFAKVRGAHVLATASPRNRDFLVGLGVDEVVDRTSGGLPVEPVDVVVDAVGGDVQRNSWKVLNPGGTLVTLPEPIDESHRVPGVTGLRVVVTPDGDTLRRIGALVDAGRVRVEVQQAFSLEQAAEAQRVSRSGQVRGKLVLHL
ncbi:NADP-dependent oxidoreductase [Streptomyces sp. 549]|uniref:NADP-dependent oxidoreductase n=1 Tax=Streptomyces sp. 549 TaxID=3049076 RepID=UPI0024C2CCFA|nr:NADP-dependent oxidoreductase [Streptomyces sp. 549]MDK1472914.1 NADP-dependent oxidoreductase [Streptomyces sp. 549]